MDYWPGPGDGAHMHYLPEVVETCLWAMAVEGGSSTKAFAGLTENWPHDGPIPSHRTMRSWKIGRFKGRYEEIMQGRGGELEEMVASRNVEFALRAEDVKADALRRTQAGIAIASGVEASMILRNVTQAQAQSIEKAGQLRGREAFSVGIPGFLESLAVLKQLGVARADVDSTAEEVDPDAADALPAPAP